MTYSKSFYRGTYGRFQTFGSHQVHFATEQILQIEFQPDVICPGWLLELNQYIHIAIFPQTIVRRRAKQSQRLDAITLDHESLCLDDIKHIVTILSYHIQIIHFLIWIRTTK
jgi:hypothetical protein